MKKHIILFVVILLTNAATAQNASSISENGLVNWLSFEEAQELYKKQPKPFIIDVYTDWCGWCKHMIRTTYSDKGVADYVNANFYPIKFNAETKDTIEYNGVKYVSTGTDKRSPHELAVKLIGQRLSYPSTLFVSNNFQFNLLSQGYIETKTLLPLLVFTVENVYRNSNYEDFKVNFNKAFFDTVIMPPSVKWHSMSEALELQKTKPKKIIVDISTGFCNSCKVMNLTSFNDEKLAKYIDTTFYLVDFNAESKDTIIINGTRFYNDGTTPFHPLANALTMNRFELPSLVILNETLEIIDIVPFYLSGKALEPIVHYFGDNEYKSLKWQEYLNKQEKTPLNTD
ncbi:hypothetical protein LDC_1085 [sediment metagenome]|uniref:Spermatogenesis-associated protein 20-like TRX domain-containing protein n=1 Tax=sediment metagenome TaxID=749907 RepID=D9PHT3_9ZZZZ